MIFRLSVSVWLAVALLVGSSGAWSSQPSRDVLFVHLDGLSEVAGNFYGETDVGAMRDILTRHTDKEPGLRNP